MNNNKALKVLQQQTVEGRKVSLLLAYVNDHGPQQASTLNLLVEQSKTLRLAAGMFYLILTPDGKYSMGQDGREVIGWLMGQCYRPTTWATLEARATSFKRITRKPHGH